MNDKSGIQTGTGSNARRLEQDGTGTTEPRYENT
jgi:hypothetical protein